MGTVAPEIHLCPAWLAEPDGDQRARRVLAERMASTRSSRKEPLDHADLAKALYLKLGEAPSVRTILDEPEKGDFPVRTPRPGMEYG